MAMKAGVWIDHQRAIVVLLTDAGQQVTKIDAGLEKPGASARGKGHKYTPNDFIAEDARERKAAGGRKIIYEKVLASVRGAESLLILGPGEAKGEFGQYIKGKKLRGVTVEVEAADKMTDRLLIGKVKQHFAIDSAKKPSAPKKTVKKAIASTAGKGSHQARRSG